MAKNNVLVNGLSAVASGVIQDEAKPGLFSPTVFVEGKAIVRNTDIFRVFPYSSGSLVFPLSS